MKKTGVSRQDGSVGGRVLTAWHMRRGGDEFIDGGFNQKAQFVAHG